MIIFSTDFIGENQRKKERTKKIKQTKSVKTITGRCGTDIKLLLKCPKGKSVLIFR